MKITIYLPAGADKRKWIRLLNSELALARNIKSKATMKHVQAGLKALKDAVRMALSKKEARRNGVILFADGSDVRMEIPPQPMSMSSYYCGREFLEEPLDEIIDQAKGPYTGIIVIDAREASVGVGRGKAVLSLGHKFSQVMNKHDAGGMSSARFGRGREEQLKAWRRKIIAMAQDLWRGYSISEVVIGGSGFEKQKVMGELKGYDTVIVNSEYTDDVYGLREAWARYAELQA